MTKPNKAAIASLRWWAGKIVEQANDHAVRIDPKDARLSLARKLLSIASIARDIQGEIDAFHHR
jgi:hypothetical protein